MTIQLAHRVLLLAMMALSSVACTSGSIQARTQQAVPRVPQNWVVDFDYASNLKTYLRRQSRLARADGKQAFVYLFDERSDHCRTIRRFADEPGFQAALSDARIVMLDARYPWATSQVLGDAAFSPGNWQPVMAAITAQGTLVAPYLYPDVYIYHFDYIPESVLRYAHGRLERNLTLRKKKLAQVMARYVSEAHVNTDDEAPSKRRVAKRLERASETEPDWSGRKINDYD